ncbi:MAG TPA: helix-turn-helix domain-containing protein [Streptosporangiaceae bacterium]|nr:helix-turn-helix domain-containing protein [Streptosporangiaceae bacterium]
MPPEVMPVLMDLLSAPEGTTAGLAAMAIGMSKSTAKNYLTALRNAGLAEAYGAGRGSRWRLVRSRAEDPAERKYQTFADLADAAHAGQVPDLAGDQQELLEQVWQIAHRPNLRLIEGEGDAQ